MPEVAAIAAPAASAPAWRLPHGACDAHSHVFGPFDRFPPRETSVYALPDAPPALHATMRKSLGVEFGVLTQPAPYGHDPAAMVAALRASLGQLRGIAAAEPDISDETLADWHEAGIRGLRFVEMRAPSGGRYPGSVGFEALTKFAPRLRESSAGRHSSGQASRITRRCCLAFCASACRSPSTIWAARIRPVARRTPTFSPCST